MSAHDRDAWEQRWERALAAHGDRLAERPPNAWLTAELADLPPGAALDAGCGHGAETFWLAARGWQVTGVDFSAKALEHAQATAAALEVADRVTWVEGDLGTWAPAPGAFDLVVSLHVHVAGDMGEFVRRMASGVAPGGTLFLVGRHPAGDQVQVSVAAARAALGDGWELVLAEDRAATSGPAGVDAVIRASARR